LNSGWVFGIGVRVGGSKLPEEEVVVVRSLIDCFFIFWKRERVSGREGNGKGGEMEGTHSPIRFLQLSYSILPNSPPPFLYPTKYVRLLPFRATTSLLLLLPRFTFAVYLRLRTGGYGGNFEYPISIGGERGELPFGVGSRCEGDGDSTWSWVVWSW
jgi:hypothetical protein